MRRFIAILVIIMTTTVGAHAQSIRLGESIPSISVSPSIDETLDLYNRDYTCLIFAHSESKPCVDAMRAFEATAHEINRSCAIVVITGEDESNSEAIIERLDIEDYIVAFDNENRTLKNFGINYVHFAVIYRTKNSRIEWFGPLHPINSKLIKDISKR
jgi:hypothetical protein